MTIKWCWVPFCRWDRAFAEHGRRDEEHLRGDGLDCDGKFTWRHAGRHLICKKCGADGT